MADRSRLRVSLGGIEFEASAMVAAAAGVLSLLAGLVALLQFATTSSRLAAYWLQESGLVSAVRCTPDPLGKDLPVS